MPPQDDFQFSSDDLSLLSDADLGDDGGEHGHDGGSSKEPSGDDKGSHVADKGADGGKPGDDGKAGDGKKGGSFVDDLDKGDDDKAGKKDGDKDADGKDKKPEDAKGKEEPPVDEWRQKLADSILAKVKGKFPEGQTDKRRNAILNDLKRFKSEADYMIAGFSARERIRSGEVRTKLTADASEEEKAAWRAENGIPAQAKDYDVPKIAGYKWTDADKPIIDSFKEAAFKGDYNQEQMNQAAEWYVANMQKQTEDYYEMVGRTNRDDRENVKAQLRDEFGPQDFQPTVRLVDRLLRDEDHMPDGLGDIIRGSSFTDEKGVPHLLLNFPPMARFMSHYARDTYGDGGTIPGDGKTKHEDVVAEADRMLAEDRERYFREGWDKKALEAMQAEEEGPKRGRRKAA